MKTVKKILTFLIVGLVISTSNVSAARKLTDEEYNNLHKLFSVGKIASLTDEEIDYYLSLDLDKTVLVQKYYKYFENLNGISYMEVSKEEAEDAFAKRMNGNTKDSTYNNMGYRSISITATPTSVTNKYFITVYNQWYEEPNVKSYDVIGLRLQNATYSEQTITGTQSYYVPAYGAYQYVNYSYNGSNIVKKTKGFGISQNLVDAATLFANDIDVIVTTTDTNSKAFGGYTHAVNDVTLAMSRSYTISSAGYCNVFAFTSGSLNYYTSYPGVNVSLSYS